MLRLPMPAKMAMVALTCAGMLTTTVDRVDAQSASGPSGEKPRETAGPPGAIDLLSSESAPRMLHVVRETVRIFACQYIVDHYAKAAGTIAYQIQLVEHESDPNTSSLVFENEMHRKLCGAIVYRVPELKTSTIREHEGYLARVKFIHESFKAFIDSFKWLGHKFANHVIHRPDEPFEISELMVVAWEFQVQLETQLANSGPIDPEIAEAIGSGRSGVTADAPRLARIRDFEGARTTFRRFEHWFDFRMTDAAPPTASKPAQPPAMVGGPGFAGAARE